jgi:hypothetical protein
MSETTPRLALPMIEAGQAQKEALHNEALTLLDALVFGMVESAGGHLPPPSPVVGQAWIVGSAPTGEWTGRADAVAVWTAGGWRFVAAQEGMIVRLRTGGVILERTATGWMPGTIAGAAVAIAGSQVVGPRLSGITDPSGGATIDIEARARISAILVALRTHGLISI